MIINDMPIRIGRESKFECNLSELPTDSSRSLIGFSDGEAFYEIRNTDADNYGLSNTNGYICTTLITSTFAEDYISYQIKMTPKNSAQDIRLLIQHIAEGGVQLERDDNSVDIFIEQRRVGEPEKYVVIATVHAYGRLADAKREIFEGDSPQELISRPLTPSSLKISARLRGIVDSESPAQTNDVIDGEKYYNPRRKKEFKLVSFENMPRSYEVNGFHNYAFRAPNLSGDQCVTLRAANGECNLIPAEKAGAERIAKLCEEMGLQLAFAYSNTHNEEEEWYDQTFFMMIGKNLKLAVSDDGLLEDLESEVSMYVLFTNNKATCYSVMTGEQNMYIEDEDITAHATPDLDICFENDEWQHDVINCLKRIF